MNEGCRRAAALVCLTTLLGAGVREAFGGEPRGPADGGRAEAYTYAAGGFVPEYAVPEPGSYRLPVIQRIGDHPLLDAGGAETTLFALQGDRTAIVAFVYGGCAETTGCPFSQAVLHRLDSAVARDAELSGHVTLMTISFDPERDTPERMAIERELHHPASNWRFATTSGAADLAPLLQDFDQPVAKLRFPDGRWTGRFRHVLKVFLLDSEHCVRNIYSVGFLNADLLLADLRTVARGR